MGLQNKRSPPHDDPKPRASSADPSTSWRLEVSCAHCSLWQLAPGPGEGSCGPWVGCRGTRPQARTGPGASASSLAASGPGLPGPGALKERPLAPPEPPAGRAGDVGHGQAARQSNRLDPRQGSCHDAAGRATGMPTLIGGPGRRDFEHGWTRVPKIMQYYRVLRMSRRQCTCPRACGPTEASFDPMYPAAALSIGARAQIVPLRPQTSSGCRVIHLRDCTASKTGALSLPSSSKRGAERPVK